MRLTSIDALRGIAVLGILFMNIPFHAHLVLGYVPFEQTLISDSIISVFYSIFVDGRFRTLFCLLFGAGLAIQYNACITHGRDANVFLKCRLHWLLVFGLVHGVFIFGGDILMLYSLAGLLVIKNLALDNDLLFIKARKLLMVGSVILLFIAAFMYVSGDISEALIRGTPVYLESVGLWQGNLGYQIMTNAAYSIGTVIISPFSVLWQTLGLMYLGVYLYRIGFFTDGFSRAVFLKIVCFAVVSTVLCAAPQVLIRDFYPGVIPLLSSVSAIFVALVYAHIMVTLCRSTSLILTILAATGKMAFSLYILQSIAMGILLRWILPEFALSATHVDYLLLALLFSFIQVIAAVWCLRKYEQGPLEFSWRWLTKRCVVRKLHAHAHSE